MPRPGPKSRTTPIPKKRPSIVKDFLGDSSVESDDIDAVQSNAESFRSAELEEDQTDYGLDYTSADPERRSTRNRSPTKSPRRTITTRSSTQPPTPNRFLPPTATSRRENQASSSNRRKRKTPLQYAKRTEREIRILQSRTDNLVPKAPFGRLIHEILNGLDSDVTRMTYTALEAIQGAAEIYLTNFFTDAYMCTLHRGRKTLSTTDFKLLQFLKKY